MAICRISLSRFSPYCLGMALFAPSIKPRTLCCSIPPSLPSPTSSSSLSSSSSSYLVPSSSSSSFIPRNRWRPMCLYYTQGKCTMMDDPLHLEKFNHDVSTGLQVNAADLGCKCQQEFDFFLVLDLEGKVEILEFPVLLIDARTMAMVDFFHRFVRPTKMSEHAINQYIEGKYGKFGVDRVWHDTALPFKEVLEEFEAWLDEHNLWKKGSGGTLNQAAFVTCGNWDLKTKVPDQCKVSNIQLPTYLMEWINLKDVYLNFYKREARGMISMMKQSEIPLSGSHHLGIDDTKNIAKVLQRMVIDGAVIRLTARRSSALGNVDFLFKNRIR